MVWTPIPRSMGEWFVDRFTGPLGDVVWFVFVSGLVVFTSFLLLAASPVFGGIIAGTILGALISDDVRAWLRDAYNRRFFRPW